MTNATPTEQQAAASLEAIKGKLQKRLGDIEVIADAVKTLLKQKPADQSK
jgi:hypothetical protein